MTSMSIRTRGEPFRPFQDSYMKNIKIAVMLEKDGYVTIEGIQK